MFQKVFNENQVLLAQKQEAEDNLKEFLATTEGHQSKQILEQREQIKLLRVNLHKLEDENIRMLTVSKRYQRKAIEEEMFLKQAMKEVETLKEVTVELQRMNLELNESPQMKLIEKKL